MHMCMFILPVERTAALRPRACVICNLSLGNTLWSAEVGKTDKKRDG